MLLRNCTFDAEYVMSATYFFLIITPKFVYSLLHALMQISNLFLLKYT